MGKKKRHDPNSDIAFFVLSECFWCGWMYDRAINRFCPECGSGAEELEG